MKSVKYLIYLLLLCIGISACQKEISVEQPAFSRGEWRFNEGSNGYNGPVDTAYIDTINGLQLLTLKGSSGNGKNQLVLTIEDTTLTAGTYKSPDATITYWKGAGIFYSNSLLSTDFTIVITKIDSLGVSGTFSGKVLDTAFKEKVVTNGYFTASFKKAATNTGGGGSADGDYLPTTVNSTWVYDYVEDMAGNPSGPTIDTVLVTAMASNSTYAGKQYRDFEMADGNGITYNGFYRKSGTDYFQYFDNGATSNSFADLNGELTLLKQANAVGAKWTSNLVTNGSAYKVRVDSKITEKNVTATVAGTSFSNVIKVSNEYYIELPGAGFKLAYTDNCWYAKGIGLIYNNLKDVSNRYNYTQSIKTYVIK